MQTRKIQRKAIRLPGRYVAGRSRPMDVAVTDVSLGGCRFEARNSRLTLGSRLQIVIAQTGPHHAIVKWANEREVGVTFDKQLTKQQFDAFKNSHVPDVFADADEPAFEPETETRPHRFC